MTKHCGIPHMHAAHVISDENKRLHRCPGDPVPDDADLGPVTSKEGQVIGHVGNTEQSPFTTHDGRSDVEGGTDR